METNGPKENIANKITEEESISYEENGNSQSENEAEIGSEQILDDSDTDSESIPLARLTAATKENDSIHRAKLKPGNFLVCKFLYNENTKREVEKKFVAKILKMDFGIQISCLRRKDSEWFVFPNVEDVSKVSLTDICAVLQTPEEKRGKFRFCEDLTDVA